MRGKVGWVLIAASVFAAGYIAYEEIESNPRNPIEKLLFDQVKKWVRDTGGRLTRIFGRYLLVPYPDHSAVAVTWPILSVPIALAFYYGVYRVWWR